MKLNYPIKNFVVSASHNVFDIKQARKIGKNTDSESIKSKVSRIENIIDCYEEGEFPKGDAKKEISIILQDVVDELIISSIVHVPRC